MAVAVFHECIYADGLRSHRYQGQLQRRELTIWHAGISSLFMNHGHIIFVEERIVISLADHH